MILSQLWLPTVQLVLQADWQVLLHSPQAVTFFSAGLAIVLIIIILLTELVRMYKLYNICLQKSSIFAYFPPYDFFKFTAIIPVTAPAATEVKISTMKVHSIANEPPITENRI